RGWAYTGRGRSTLKSVSRWRLAAASRVKSGSTYKPSFVEFLWCCKTSALTAPRRFAATPASAEPTHATAIAAALATADVTSLMVFLPWQSSLVYQTAARLGSATYKAAVKLRAIPGYLDTPSYSPPVVVRRMVPSTPTASPCSASENETANRSTLVPLGCEVQVSPPSVVRTIVPELPTAVPTSESTKETP